MGRTVEVEIKFRGGFPLKARCEVCPAEHDVGIMRPYVDDFELFTMAGKPADFLKITKDEEEEITEAIDCAVFAPRSWWDEQ